MQLPREPRQLVRWLRASALLAIGFAIFTPLFFGALDPDYSQARDYISELGAMGAAHATWVKWVGFLPTGLFSALFVLLLFLIWPKALRLRVALLLWLGVSLGYLGAIVWPCDPGCPAAGSARQQVHNLLGLVQYGAGGVSLLLVGFVFLHMPMARGFALFSLVLAGVVWWGLAQMADPAQEEWRGGWQRLSEAGMFGWMAVVAWRMPRRSHPRPLANEDG